MLIKVIAVLAIIITMSSFTGTVPGKVFKENVSNNELRSMLNLVDSAIVAHFCGHLGQLPSNLNELQDLGVDSGVLNSMFEYAAVAGSPQFALKIKNTEEFSANSNRELVATALDFTRDENGESIFVAQEPTIDLSVYLVDPATVSRSGFVTLEYGGLLLRYSTPAFSDGRYKTFRVETGVGVGYEDGTTSNEYSGSQFSRFVAACGGSISEFENDQGKFDVMKFINALNRKVRGY